MNEESNSRREFIKNTGKAGIAVGLSAIVLPSLANSVANEADAATPFEQSPLPYSYSALEPVIDAQTMELHYSKHAAAYAKNLNEACTAENVNKETTSLEQLLAGISKYSVKMRNNAGGHYNHELFWKTMQATSSAMPTGKLMDAINTNFTSFAAFKNEFNEAAKTRFGSGWAWLVMTNDKKLIIGSTPNQDNPLMDVSALKGMPVFGLDVWEHAYYLHYQNRRPDYISEWWKVVNWQFIQQRFEAMV
jgi:Fe-Mn family superoxide dismutase